MIISTSSHNVQLTGKICAYVETTLRVELGRVAGEIGSVDVQLDGVRRKRGRQNFLAAIRIDLRNGQSLSAEARDDDLYMAVRRAAQHSAQVIGLQLRQSAPVSRQWLPQQYQGFSRYTAPNV